MTSHPLHNILYSQLEEIAAAEKITRKVLASMSRDLLKYVPETHDIDIVNRLVGVLTPVNRQVAILYFRHFLPWSVEEDNNGTFVRFGKMAKGDKKISNKLKAIEDWLSDEGNNIWVWGEDNIEIKKKDFQSTVKKAIEKALKGDEKSDTPPLTRKELMYAIFSGGVTLEDMLLAVEERQEEMNEAGEQYLKSEEESDAA